MKALFDTVSFDCSRKVTSTYSTSFSAAVRMLAPSIRQDIHNIYGFVRFADEIVDTFHEYDKQRLFDAFEHDLERALADGISLNPILNSFQHTVRKYSIGRDLIDAFMHSMRLDLSKSVYETKEEYAQYIYGSADVVGLMCLTVFVKGNREKYEALKGAAVKLGSAFQKVNFLRDLKADFEGLNRTYFPGTDLNRLDEAAKMEIVREIEADFADAYDGIRLLPMEAKFGVYTAYVYYRRLLTKLKKTPSSELVAARVRVPNYEKFGLFAKSYIVYRFNFV
ncbi:MULTISPECIES: phytoene/squalene synthase family protein [unclassified Flavobacterium]|uniref:phytoene/squalene synthase family protein n=1 Tax=unclassified Flavobacterium TaxID=196869 RepID=UPI001F131564|nr:MULTISPECIES: phytoene/squalene synthase family protein [unclassified Flavobacterium]UMY65550.1 phytoene/squalene synthase family protein [Flavobacterium sp. HJ-32-4]